MTPPTSPVSSAPAHSLPRICGFSPQISFMVAEMSLCPQTRQGWQLSYLSRLFCSLLAQGYVVGEGAMAQYIPYRCAFSMSGC